MGLRGTKSRLVEPDVGASHASRDAVRVLFVCAEGQIGGAEKSLLLLMRSLRRRCEVSLACPSAGQLAARAEAIGCRLHEIPARRAASYLTPRGLVDLLRLNLAVRQVAAVADADILHANSVYAMVACVLAIALGARMKIVWHSRDILSLAWVSRVAGWLSDRVVAISESVGWHLMRQGVPAAKIAVVYNAAGPAVEGLVVGRRAGRSNTEAARQIVFANVGQFIPWKRQTLFVAAAARVAGRLPNASFHLVGDDVFGRGADYRDQIRRAVDTRGLAGRVHFDGWRKEMAEVWERTDCLVHTANREPFGRVVIEAMAAGVPVIAVDAFGPAEIIEHDVTGILVPPDNPAALADAMLRVAGDSALAQRLAVAAQERCRREFRTEDVADRIEEIYDDFRAVTPAVWAGGQ